MKRKVLLTLFSLYNFTTLAQNLITNSGFEDYFKLQCIIKEPFTNGTDLKNWTCPTVYPALIHSTRFDSLKCRYSVAHSGHNSVRFLIVNEFYSMNGYYLQCKLLTPLESGKKYFLEYYMKPLENFPSSYNNMGVYFTSREMKSYSEALNVTSQIKKSEAKYEQEGEWIHYSAWFTINFKASHLIIGRVYNDLPSEQEMKEIAKISGSKNKRWQYNYLMDDFYLGENEPKRSTELFTIKKEPIVLENVYFKTNEYILLAESFPELKNLLSFLLENPTVKIEISGHTDNTGDKIINLKLSEQRAKAVYDYLISNGVNGTRLSYQGLGDTHSIANNSFDEGRMKNRRVEVRIIDLLK